MAGARTPEQALDELGGQLDAAFRRDLGTGRGLRLARRSWVSGRRRALIAGAVVVALGASTAAATRSLLSPSPPAPLLAPLGLEVASGNLSGERWTLSVSRCLRPARSESVVLRAGSGGAGTSCGPDVRFPGVYYDPARRNALVFGLLPSGTTRAELITGAGRREVVPVGLDRAAQRAAGLPSGTVGYVLALPADAVVSAVVAFDSGSHLTLVCQRGGCVRP